MACLSAPTLPIPELPFPFSATPPSFPLPGFDASLCCKTLNLPPWAVQAPLPPLFLNPAFAVAAKAAMQTFDTWQRSLTIPCPLEE